MTEYTPDEMTAREMYLAGSTLYRETPEQHYLGAPEPDYRAEFDRFLARVKRDAEARIKAVEDVLEESEARGPVGMTFNGTPFPAWISIATIRRALDGDA